MVDLFGVDYILDHYFASYRASLEKDIFSHYIADAVMAIANNTSKHVGWGGVVDMGYTMAERWSKLSESTQKQEQTEDNRSCKEIADSIWKRVRNRK